MDFLYARCAFGGDAYMDVVGIENFSHTAAVFTCQRDDRHFTFMCGVYCGYDVA